MREWGEALALILGSPAAVDVFWPKGKIRSSRDSASLLLVASEPKSP